MTTPTRVGRWVIPPGTIVWPMLYALHNSRHNWDQPDHFRPERWLRPEEAGGEGGEGRVGSDAGEAGSSGGEEEGRAASPGGGGGSPRQGRAVAAGGAVAVGAAGGKRFLPFSDGMKSCLGQVGG